MKKKRLAAAGLAAVMAVFAMPLAGFTLTAEAADSGYTVEFTGTAQNPSVNVYDSTDGCLIPPSEYTVSYSDNTSAGTATVTITDALTGATPGAGSSGNYAITQTTTTFTITSVSAKPTVTLGTPIYMYDKNPHKADVTVKIGSTVIPSSEYTLTYLRDGAETDDFVSGGTITVQVSDVAGGNYELQDATADYVINSPVTSFGKFEYDQDGDGKISKENGDISISAEDFNTTIAAATAAAQAADSASKTASLSFDENGLYVTTQDAGKIVWSGTLSSVPSMYTGSGHYKLVVGSGTVGNNGSDGYGDSSSGFTIFFDGTNFSVFAGGTRRANGSATDACYVWKVN